MPLVITNFHRAGFARNALTTFLEETWHSAPIERLNMDDLKDAIADLVCDLLHLANQSGLHPEQIVAQAQANYDADLAEAQP